MDPMTSIRASNDSFSYTKSFTSEGEFSPFVTTTDTIGSSHSVNTQGIVSNEIYRIFSIIFSLFLSGTCGILGIVTNAITIAIFFIRQGFKESVNISLFGLAIADMCCVVTMLWSSVCTLFLHATPSNFLFDPRSLQLMTASYPRVIATRLTCWMTALISIERCLCVTLPLKIKTLLTPKKVLALTTAAFVTVIFSYAIQLYSVRKLSLVFNSKLNKTQYVMIQEEKSTAFNISRGIWHTLLPVLNLLVILVCTLIMVAKLKMSSQWRMNAMTGHGQDRVNVAKRTQQVSSTSSKETGSAPVVGRTQEKSLTKEAKMTKLVLSIITLFIICNGPTTVFIFVTFFIPQFQSLGRYRNLFYITNMVLFLMETINSSVNLFVFYKMSSRFKSEFKLMFPSLSN